MYHSNVKFNLKKFSFWNITEQNSTFSKQLFLIFFSINVLHYSALIHGSPLRYVVSWNHIAFKSWLPGGDSSKFPSNSSLSRSNATFDTPACLVNTPNFQLYTSHKPFLITICFHDFRHLPIIPDGICFLEDHNISNLQVPFSVIPCLSFLKWLQESIPPATMEFI